MLLQAIENLASAAATVAYEMLKVVISMVGIVMALLALAIAVHLFLDIYEEVRLRRQRRERERKREQESVLVVGDSRTMVDSVEELDEALKRWRNGGSASVAPERQTGA